MKATALHQCAKAPPTNHLTEGAWLEIGENRCSRTSGFVIRPDQVVILGRRPYTSACEITGNLLKTKQSEKWAAKTIFRMHANCQGRSGGGRSPDVEAQILAPPPRSN